MAHENKRQPAKPPERVRAATRDSAASTGKHSAAGRFVPTRDKKTGSYTTERSTKALKDGASKFAGALKRLADK